MYHSNNINTKSIDRIIQNIGWLLKVMLASPLPFQRDPNVDKLVYHPINEAVRFNGEHIVYCKNGKIACDRGLTTMLSAFFEGYKRPTKADVREYCAMTGEKMIPPRQVIKIGDCWNKVSQMEKDSNKSGRALGTLVHNQLCLYARSKNETEFKKVCPNPHDYTQRAISKLSDSGIRLFFAEFAIVDSMLKYVTSIDLVGVNSERKLTLLEVKTGYDNIFTIGRVPLKKPFEAWVNSPLNQARLQLLLPCLTLKYQYDVTVDSAWVLNVNSHNEKLYPLLKGMLKSPEILYNYLMHNYGIGAASLCTRRIQKIGHDVIPLSRKRKASRKIYVRKGRRSSYKRKRNNKRNTLK